MYGPKQIDFDLEGSSTKVTDPTTSRCYRPHRVAIDRTVALKTPTPA